MLAARFIGVKNFGLFSTILAVVGILSKLVDFGIEPIVFREFSIRSKDFGILNLGLTLKFSIYLLLITGFNLTVPFFNFSLEEILLYNILFTTILFSMKMINVRELLSTPFKVNLKMHYPMTFSIIDNLILLLLIILIPYSQNKVLFFTIIYAASNIPGFVLSFYYLYKKFGYKFRINFNKAFWIIKESIPLFGFVILTTIFSQIDIIILNHFTGYYNVGIYSAAVRLTLPLNIIPQAIVTTVFPLLVKKLSDKIDANYLSNLVIKLLFFISVVIAMGFSFKSAELIKIVFGNEYADAALPTIILFWCQVFLFFAYYSQSILIADNKQLYNFLFGLIQVVANVGLNLFLIPKYLYTGAAAAKLITSIVSFIFLLFVLKKFGFYPTFKNGKILIWFLIMLGAFYLMSYLSLIFYLILLPVLVLSITLLVNIFNKDEMLLMFRLANLENFGRKIISKI